MKKQSWMFVVSCLLSASSIKAQSKPNILVIFSDAVGITKINAYGQGVVGY